MLIFNHVAAVKSYKFKDCKLQHLMQLWRKNSNEINIDLETASNVKDSV